METDESPYAKLGLTENASFEAIQEARVRLMQEYSGDRKRLQAIETAYDAILMDRLRLRQEGKIKVPERIRFPERLTPMTTQVATTTHPKTLTWFKNFLDQPSQPELLWTSGVFITLSTISIFSPNGDASLIPLALAIGGGATLYFLNQKENKFGRAVVLTLVGLITGLTLGGLLGSVLMTAIPWTIETISALATFIILWMVSSFLK